MAVAERPPRRRPDGAGADHLADALEAELANSSASFELMAHVQLNEELHPTDAPQVSWSQNGARCVRLAQLLIPAQPVDRRSQLAERVVMSPWNCLAAHEPLGEINRARRTVYPKLAEERLSKGESEVRRWSNVPEDAR